LEKRLEGDQASTPFSLSGMFQEVERGEKEYVRSKRRKEGEGRKGILRIELID